MNLQPLPSQSSFPSSNPFILGNTPKCLLSPSPAQLPQNNKTFLAQQTQLRLNPASSGSIKPLSTHLLPSPMQGRQINTSLLTPSNCMFEQRPLSDITASKPLMAESDTASAIFAYRKYYTDVLAYFKTLLDKTEEASNSYGCQPHDTTSPVQNVVPPENDAWTHSKTIMAGYFRQKGDRDWDWASWHNYLSWISRTHPEWFRLFTDCSKQMGIDWEVMYKQWMASKSTMDDPLPTFDLSRPPPETVVKPDQAPPPPIANPLSLTSMPPPSDPRVWCEDCDQYFVAQRAYDIHLRGVCHIQNALTKTITNNASIVLDIPPPVQHLSHQLLPPPPPHQRPVSQGKPFRNFQKPTHKPQLRLQHLLDVCIQPLVGLNYVTEFQRCGLLDCIYICDLCKQRAFLPPEVIRHVCGIGHRMAYLKQHYPPLHHLVSRDKSDRSIRERRLTSYAQQIECTEGRKRPSIMYEKENLVSAASVFEWPASLAVSSFPSPASMKSSSDRPPQRKLETSPPVPPSPPASSSPPRVHISTLPPNEGPSTEVIQCPHDEDDEIEEGEMLDSSSGEEDGDDEGDVGTMTPAALSSPAVTASSPSSSFSSPSPSTDRYRRVGGGLPSFFTCGIEGIEEAAKEHSAGGLIVHLPDFDVGFVSERPLLPKFDIKDDASIATFSDFVNELATKGVLNVATKDNKKLEEVPLFTRLAQSFEAEVTWALKQLSGVPQMTNPLQFAYHHPPELYMKDNGGGEEETATTTRQSPNPTAQPQDPSISLQAIQVLTSSSSSPPLIPSRPVALEALPEPSCRDPEELRRVAEAFLAKLEGRPPPPQSAPMTAASDAASTITPQPTPPGQSIPVLMSNPPRVLHMNFDGSVITTTTTTTKIAPVNTPIASTTSRGPAAETSTTATKPKRPRLEEAGSTATDAVRCLLDSPLDALQALLEGGLKPSSTTSSSNPAVVKSANPPLLPTPPSTSEMFDGYSYFSQKHEEQQHSHPSYSSAANRPPPLTSFSVASSTPRSSVHPKAPLSSTSSSSSRSGGSKLAAFADMLGMNEPPPPSRPHLAPPQRHLQQLQQQQHPSQLSLPAEMMMHRQPAVLHRLPMPGAALVAAGLNPAAWLTNANSCCPPLAGAAAQFNLPTASNSSATAAAAALLFTSNMLGGMTGLHYGQHPPGWRR